MINLMLKRNETENLFNLNILNWVKPDARSVLLEDVVAELKFPAQAKPWKEISFASRTANCCEPGLLGRAVLPQLLDIPQVVALGL